MIPEGRDLMEISLIGLSVLRFLILYIMYCMPLSICICPHLLQEEASLMMAEQGTFLNRMSFE